MSFYLSKHVKERYVERVLGGLKPTDNLNILILEKLSKSKDITNKVYDEIPRYILFLYEKYKQLGITILRYENIIFITKKREGTYGLYDILTCYLEDTNYLKQFKNTALSRMDIFIQKK